MNEITIREAVQSDSSQIGLLHAISWQMTYRDILPDSFLDNNLEEERRTYWLDKLSHLSLAEFVLVAETAAGELLGFIAIMDQGRNATDGFIDNLHVTPKSKGMGIGSRLMKAAAQRLRDAGVNTAYLWVLKGNIRAEEFYKARGARPADSTTVSFGDASVSQTRFIWDSLEALINL